MGFPVIGYDTIYRNAGGALTASSTESGFPVANLKDLKAFTIWKSGTTTSPIDIDLDLGASGHDLADYICLVNHNLASEAGSVTVYADDVTIGTTIITGPYTPASDEVDYRAFTAPGDTRRYWRVRLSKGGNFTNKPFIGEIQVGLKTVLPEYVAGDIDPFLRKVDAMGPRSQGGHALGRLLRGLMHRSTLVFGGDAGVVRSFVTADIDTFLRNRAERREPFVFVLDPDDADFDTPLWLVVPDDEHPERLPVAGTWARFVVRLPVTEAWSEAA